MSLTAQQQARFVGDEEEDAPDGPIRFSSSCASTLVQRSPLHAWQEHPRLGGVPREPSESMEDGTLVHALVLNAGLDKIAVLDVNDFRTNAAKEKRDAALAEGKCVVKRADFDVAKAAAEKITQRIRDYGIEFDQGWSERKIEWTEETPDGALVCRGKPDHYLAKRDHETIDILELKTIRSGSVASCQRAIESYAYDIQEAAYRSALGKLYPWARGRISFTFLFAEIDLPCAVTPIRLTGLSRERGEMKWAHACATFAHCLKTDEWPAYVREVTQIDPPPWAQLA